MNILLLYWLTYVSLEELLSESPFVVDFTWTVYVAFILAPRALINDNKGQHGRMREKAYHQTQVLKQVKLSSS